MDLVYILAGIPNPAQLDSDATRHKIAWRRGERTRKSVKHNRPARTETPFTELKTTSRPEAFL